MFHVLLYQPEIPPNTGNIIRLCANTGAQLHLIEPLGFTLDDTRLRRAGLDYREWAEVQTHPSFSAFKTAIRPNRILAFTTRANRCYSKHRFMPDDALLFGPETRGIPEELLNELPEEWRLRLPMRPDNRSLNLSNSVAVALYEAWRQQGFAGSTDETTPEV
ncbi:MAG: tRNA (cytidine(34)-2'-O)-methyltransferase [Gammaproteobacteria bacterium]|nr:tRNA (cytidine(34)-2'-O)-methyltransferase [Gammaproteobacteria bacterium]